MATATQGTASNYLQRAPSPSGLADVVDLILDKGLVIDAYVRIAVIGIELITIDARIVIASVDTYLRFAEAGQPPRPDRDRAQRASRAAGEGRRGDDGRRDRGSGGRAHSGLAGAEDDGEGRRDGRCGRASPQRSRRRSPTGSAATTTRTRRNREREEDASPRSCWLPVIAAGASLAARLRRRRRAPSSSRTRCLPWLRETAQGAGDVAEKLPDKARSAVSSGGDLAEQLTDRARDVTGDG